MWCAFEKLYYFQKYMRSMYVYVCLYVYIYACMYVCIYLFFFIFLSTEVFCEPKIQLQITEKETINICHRISTFIFLLFFHLLFIILRHLSLSSAYSGCMSILCIVYSTQLNKCVTGLPLPRIIIWFFNI